EIRAMKNYAGSRLSPWLGHLMISRQETARPLLTPGEIMQLPPDDEIVMISGSAPVRAKKVRYYEDSELAGRILPPPPFSTQGTRPAPGVPATAPDDAWAGAVAAPSPSSDTEDPDNAGIRREPELPEHEEIVPEPRKPVQEFEPIEDEPDDDAQRQRLMQRNFGNARQISLDTDDDMRM
ncbi:type IV secretory system conjugative DNA transfer family protein, partial [Gaiella sp.]|uniref:type IV secretory system conjugative DNA transfer family protein n=1 Tax=Gaiella sp. TaxID=2663207 RepID=UPI002E2FEDA0